MPAHSQTPHLGPDPIACTPPSPRYACPQPVPAQPPVTHGCPRCACSQPVPAHPPIPPPHTRPQARTFGLFLCRLDIRQESVKHTEAMDAITTYLGLGSYK